MMYQAKVVKTAKNQLLANLKRWLGAPSLAMLPLLVLFSACGDNTPNSPEEDPPFVIPAFERIPADPSGILLPGDPESSALSATRWMSPTPAGSEQVGDNGLILDRLTAGFHIDATVAEVNAALSASNATISSMCGGNPVVSLRIPAVADEDALQAIAESLTATGAFVYAGVARTVVPVVPAGDVLAVIPPNADPFWYQEAMKLFAAWNVRDGVDGSLQTLIYTTDYFPHENGVDGVGSNLLFLDGSGLTAPDIDSGYHSAGLMAGRFDGPAPGVATHSDVFVLAMHAFGLSHVELIHELAAQLGDVGEERFLLHTPHLYFDVDEPFDTFQRGDRAVDALNWRIAVHVTQGLHDPDVLHVVPAGEDVFDRADAADYMSPWAMAARIDNLLEFAEAGGETEAAKVRPLWEAYSQVFPAVTAPLANVLIVGAASNPEGLRLPTSAAGADLLAPGENVYGACAVDCEADGLKSRGGTPTASSLVTGLAAYMWSLKGDLTSQEIVNKMERAASGRFLDAYASVLAVDSAVGLVDGLARLALLDVTGYSLGSQPNGIFDEYDIEQFLTFFESFEVERELNGVFMDHSRYDLNGNGYTGGDPDETSFPTRGWFDLDAAAGPAWNTVTQTIGATNVTFDEQGVTDAEILCYYAHSPIYRGLETVRDELLADTCNAVVLEVTFPDQVVLNVANTMTITVGTPEGNDLVGEPGVQIELSVFGGMADPFTGTTSAEGLFSSTITATTSGQLSVTITATLADDQVLTKTVVASVGEYSLIVDFPDVVAWNESNPITLTLLDGDGNGVSGARVDVTHYGGILEGFTDEDGVLASEIILTRVGDTPLAVGVRVDGVPVGFFRHAVQVIPPLPTIYNEAFSFVYRPCESGVADTGYGAVSATARCEDNGFFAQSHTWGETAVHTVDGYTRSITTSAGWEMNWDGGSPSTGAHYYAVYRFFVSGPAVVTMDVEISNGPISNSSWFNSWGLGGQVPHDGAGSMTQEIPANSGREVVASFRVRDGAGGSPELYENSFTVQITVVPQ